MPLADALGRLAARKKVVWQLQPELLLQPNVPQPMHGVAPRVVLGTKWWDAERKRAYASTAYHCQACGVWKFDALGRRWLEGHEVYRIDYCHGRMYYLRTAPLCHYCHNYIHSGRLLALLESGKITHAKYTAIIQHGDEVIKRDGLKFPKPYEGEIAVWSKWRLVVNGKEYPPLYKSQKAWERAFNK